MGQVRWAGWTMAIATALVISGGQVVRADVQSDRPAAIVVYPDIEVDLANNVDTVIRLTNTNVSSPDPGVVLLRRCELALLGRS